MQEEKIARGMPRPKCPFTREVPPEIDILDDYRAKFDLKRTYQEPVKERHKIKVCFQEEFYNKARVREVYVDGAGVEQVPSANKAQQQRLEQIEQYTREAATQINEKKLGMPR